LLSLILTGCSQKITVQNNNLKEIKANCYFQGSQFGLDPLIICTFINKMSQIGEKCFSIYEIKIDVNGEESISAKHKLCSGELLPNQASDPKIVSFESEKPQNAGSSSINREQIEFDVMGGKVIYTLRVELI